MTTTTTCDVCHEPLTAEAIRMGWPIPRLEDGELVGPCCYGDEAHCPEGHVLPADNESSDCAMCA